MNTTKREMLFVTRNAQGVIVGISQFGVTTIPPEPKKTTTKPTRSDKDMIGGDVHKPKNEIEVAIARYAEKKRAKKHEQHEQKRVN